jgi:hypothetical protein
VKLTEANPEAEIIDSTTGEELAAVSDRLGSRTNKKEFTTWQDLQAELSVYG